MFVIPLRHGTKSCSEWLRIYSFINFFKCNVHHKTIFQSHEDDDATSLGFLLKQDLSPLAIYYLLESAKNNKKNYKQNEKPNNKLALYLLIQRICYHIFDHKFFKSYEILYFFQNCWH